jgi:putative tryptophan/tyrosine transport system substrate-binding protein
MNRREFIALIGGAAATPSLLAPLAAQQSGRAYRIGLLGGAVDSGVIVRGYPALRDELRKRGFIDGRNLVVDFRSTRQEPGRLFADVADLVRSDVDLIVAVGPDVAVKAALAASSTIPIVMWANNFDPIAHGYVQSLARPGSSVTGILSKSRY